MIIRTKTPYSGKGKIWIKFIIGEREFERFFKVIFRGMQKGNFSYEVDDDFPEEMVRLVFGYGAMIGKSEL
jgi:hypothetical protein